MDQDTLKALRASIEHWEENARQINPDDIVVGSWACALCQKFVEPFTYETHGSCYYENYCVGCPVYERTGYKGCEGTPYETVVDLLEDSWYSNKEVFEAVRKELEFLKSLLPDEEKT